MQFSSYWFGRLVAASLIAALLAPAAAAQAPAGPQNKTAPAATSIASPPPELAPDDAQAAQAELALPDAPTPQSAQDGAQSPQQAPAPASDPSQQQNNQQQNNQPQNGSKPPVGTAAAPYEKTMGVAASRPAGAVIAPAKQRRVRTIWISLAVVAATGIAVGTVVGLSKGSSSRP